MGKTRRTLYINVDIKNQELIYTGITFCDFMKHIKPSIKNMLLLKSDYIGDRCFKNFELLEGKNAIDLFIKDDAYNYGEFCFVDYLEYENIDQMADQQIAELLFMAHMFKPLTSPFYNSLNNRFVYLAHDDGFYCKLYCREVKNFKDVLSGKIVDLTTAITKQNIASMDRNTQDKLMFLAQNGLLLDFKEMMIDKNQAFMEIYVIGKYMDMNEVLNKEQFLKKNALHKVCLKYKDHMWHIE